MTETARTRVTARIGEPALLRPGGPLHLVVEGCGRAAWSASRAGEGDVVGLRAEQLALADASEVTLEVYERDAGADDDLVERIAATARGGRVEAEWTVRYAPDDDVDAHLLLLATRGFTRPTWYFVVRDEDGAELASSGTEAERLLVFQQDLDVAWRDVAGRPLASTRYRIWFPRGGAPVEGTSDAQGRIRHADVPPGPFHVQPLTLLPGRRRRGRWLASGRGEGAQ